MQRNSSLEHTNKRRWLTTAAALGAIATIIGAIFLGGAYFPNAIRWVAIILGVALVVAIFHGVIHSNPDNTP